MPTSHRATINLIFGLVLMVTLALMARVAFQALDAPEVVEADPFRLTNIDATLAEAVASGLIRSGHVLALRGDRVLHDVQVPWQHEKPDRQVQAAPLALPQLALVVLALHDQAQVGQDDPLGWTLPSGRSVAEVLAAEATSAANVCALEEVLATRLGMAPAHWLESEVLAPATAVLEETGQRRDALPFVFAALANQGTVAGQQLFSAATVEQFIRGKRGAQRTLGFESQSRPNWGKSTAYRPLVGQARVGETPARWADPEVNLSYELALEPGPKATEVALNELEWRLGRLLYESIALRDKRVARLVDVLP